MYSLSTPALSVNYRDTFRPLIAFDEDSDPLDLIDTEKALNGHVASSSAASSSTGGGLFHLLFSSPSSTPDPGKLFRRKFESWINDLDQCLEDSRYNPVELASLQEAVRPIFLKGTTTIIRRKINKLRAGSTKLDNILKKLDKYILRILRTPSLAKIASASPDCPALEFTSSHFGSSISTFNRAGFLRPAGSVCLPAGTAPVDPKLISQQVAEQTRRLIIIRKVREVTLHSPKSGRDWEEKFIKGVEELNSEKELIELGNQISPLQLTAVIHAFITHPKGEWKLPLIFGRLDTSTLIEILTSLDSSELCILNVGLKRGVGQNPVWFREALKSQAESLKQQCSEIKERVDALTERIKADEKCQGLRRRDMQLIHELADNVHLRLLCMTEKLPDLYKDIIEAEELHKLFFETIPSQLKLLHKRLTSKEASADDHDISLLPTIYEKVFSPNVFDLDDEAYEILGAWVIYNLGDYRNVGLFGRLSKEEYDQLSQKIKPGGLFQLAADNLAFLGIKKINDWIRLEIFNKIMLKEYLSNEDRSKQLRERSLELLT